LWWVGRPCHALPRLSYPSQEVRILESCLVGNAAAFA
jgi:hypothetical protein